MFSAEHFGNQILIIILYPRKWLCGSCFRSCFFRVESLLLAWIRAWINNCIPIKCGMKLLIHIKLWYYRFPPVWATRYFSDGLLKQSAPGIRAVCFKIPSRRPRHGRPSTVCSHGPIWRTSATIGVRNPCRLFQKVHSQRPVTSVRHSPLSRNSETNGAPYWRGLAEYSNTSNSKITCHVYGKEKITWYALHNKNKQKNNCSVVSNNDVAYVSRHSPRSKKWKPSVAK